MGYGVPDSGVDFVYITPHEAYLLMKNDLAVFVDGRDLDNYETTRIQTSFHLSANDLIFNKQKIDMAMVQHLIDLAKAGKTVVALSDACITGAKNRGHVSRCRHVAQYLVELGADRQRVVRMTGGINAWKAAKLDGILGDLRPYFAGAVQAEGFHAPEIQSPGEQAAADEDPDEGEVVYKDHASGEDLNGKKAKALEHIADAGRWEVEMLDEGCNKEHVRCKPDNLIVLTAAKKPDAPVAKADLPTTRVCCGGDVSTDGQTAKMMREVVDVPPRAWLENTPTCYRVVKTELFKKPSRESDKIIKIERPITALIRTTGEVHEGANGGRWAELDVTAGEKRGWIYIEGPGFGPSSRKIRSEYLKT